MGQSRTLKRTKNTHWGPIENVANLIGLFQLRILVKHLYSMRMWTFSVLKTVQQSGLRYYSHRVVGLGTVTSDRWCTCCMRNFFRSMPSEDTNEILCMPHMRTTYVVRLTMCRFNFFDEQLLVRRLAVLYGSKITAQILIHKFQPTITLIVRH